MPLISVVIPTYNRAKLLRGTLLSLVEQTLPLDDFELVVVDDGSTDHTEDVCSDIATGVPLRYLRLARAGIAAAKNAGLFASQGAVCLFFDDDDVAHSEMLEAHVSAHREHVAESRAVLGYTAWSPELAITPVMRFVIDVGQQ